MQRFVSHSRIAAVSAAMLFVVAVAAFGAAFEGFSQLRHPVAALGASGVPRAWWFNVAAFVVPGAIAACVAQAARARMAGAPYLARLGVQMLALAGLAFAALGLLPLDSANLLSNASVLHSAAWTLWWVAFGGGAVLSAAGMRTTSDAPRARRILACAAVALLFATLLPGAVPVGLSQRIAFGAWRVAIVVRGASRGEASTPGTPSTGRG